MDTQRYDSNGYNNNLRTVSTIFLWKLIFSGWAQQTTKLQKINKHCLGDTTQKIFYIKQRKERTDTNRIHKIKTDKNDVTYINCTAPITSLSLSKIGYFVQVQPLWWEKRQNRDGARRNSFLVKAKLLHLK